MWIRLLRANETSRNGCSQWGNARDRDWRPLPVLLLIFVVQAFWPSDRTTKAGYFNISDI